MNKDPALRFSILVASLFVFLIWWIKLSETLFGWDLHHLGVYPQAFSGLIGIATGPLIHGSWSHVIGNTLPILLLGSLLIYGYPRSRWWTLAIIWLVSGLGVWLFGRESYHFGASGLTHGMFFYLLTGGLIRRDKRSIVLLMVAFFMYGGMLLTILPREPDISYEYHLFGALGGLLCALGFRNWDPKLADKTYAWEQQAEDEQDPIIGDQWKMEPPPDTRQRCDDYQGRLE
ncbi:MAG: membrane associated rhomboid family serine protease [Motiliproteus sp.]|jgi:membrane associated rhomboid family serine protease